MPKRKLVPLTLIGRLRIKYRVMTTKVDELVDAPLGVYIPRELRYKQKVAMCYLKPDRDDLPAFCMRTKYGLITCYKKTIKDIKETPILKVK